MSRSFFMLSNISIFLIIFAYQPKAFSQDKQLISSVNRPLSQSLGVRLELLVSAHQLVRAETLINSGLKDPKYQELKNFRLAELAALRKKSREWRLLLSKTGNSLLTRNTKLMADMYRGASNEDKKWLSSKLASWGFFNPPLESPCPFFELDQRKRRGEFLHILSDQQLDKINNNAIWNELYLLIPEVVDEKKYNLNPEFLSWQKQLKAPDFLKRMNNLLVFGKNLEARQTFHDAIKIVPELSHAQRCELDYVNAKIERKLRRYANARAQFQALNKSCPSEVAIKAEYMDLMLASMAGDLSVADQFDRFVSKYPTHGFSDDVLLFKANMYLEKTDYASALASLNLLEQQFPTGDMIKRALFVKGFLLARLGRIDEALGSLKKLKLRCLPDELSFSQAEYWIARLMLFPDVASLKDPHKKNSKNAGIMLQGLIGLEHKNVYSWLALQLLNEIGQKPVFEAKHKPLPYEKPKSEKASLQFISMLVEQGFRREALALLDEERVGAEQEVSMGVIADAYIHLGQPELGHQKLIKCDESLAISFRRRWPELYRQIAWPKPYTREVKLASARVDVPPPVIFSMMRQESGFIAEATSWAQARGLMQLIGSTAGEQAKRLGINNYNVEDLFRPELNLLLGSSALFGYWQRFGHLAVALSAYNAGPVAAKKWLKENAKKPLDTYIESISFKETEAYVKSVLGGAFNYGLMDGHHLPMLSMQLVKDGL